MEITPPGDARPGFSHDIELARRTLDSQFGPGAGAAVLPEGRLVVLNKAPALDRMDEVIADGAVLGTMRYDVGRGWTFLPRMQAARAMEAVMTKGRIVADDGAVPFVLKGSNLLAPEWWTSIRASRRGRGGRPRPAGACDRRRTGQDGFRGHDAAPAAWPSRCDGWRSGAMGRKCEHRPGRRHRGQPAGDGQEGLEAVAFMKRVIGQHDLPAMISFSGARTRWPRCWWPRGRAWTCRCSSSTPGWSSPRPYST